MSNNFATFKIKLDDLVSPQLKKLIKNKKLTSKTFDSETNKMSKSIAKLSIRIKKFPPVKVLHKKPVRALKKVEKQAEELDKKGGKSIGNFKRKARGLNSLGRAFKGGGISSLGSSLRFAGSGFNPIIAGFGLATIGAYKLGETVANSNSKIRKNLETTSNYIKGNSFELKSITSKVTALSKVYGSDYTETLKTASLLTNKFGISAEKSIDIIQKGFSSGANTDGGMLKYINEHSNALKSLGMTAEEQIATMQQSTLNGINNTPQLLKSFSSNISKLSTTKALGQALGSDFVVKLKNDLSKGKITVTTALSEISNAVNSSSLSSSSIQNLSSKIFGDNSENATKLLNNFSSYETRLDKIISRNGALNKTKQQQYKLENRIASSQLQHSKSISKISDKLTIMSLQAKAAFYDNLGGIMKFAGKVKNLGNSIYNLSDKIGLIKVGTGILNYLFNNTVTIIDSLTKGMDWASDKIDGLTGNNKSKPKKRYKNEGFQGSPFIKTLDRFKTPKTSILAIDKNTKTINKWIRHKDDPQTPDTPTKTTTTQHLDNGINSITTGGKRVRNLYVTVERMVESITINSSVKEGANSVREEIQDLFVKVIQGSEITLNRG